MRLVWDIDEEWRDVVGAEDRYEVSDKGRVRSKSYVKSGRNIHGPFTYTTKSKLMAVRVNPDGYPQTNLRLSSGKDRSVTVHRLVAEAFIPNPNCLPQVNHKDSNRQNSVLENLEWCTAQEIVQHSYDYGLNSNAGEKHPRSVLTVDDVRKIRDLWQGGKSVINIARELNFKRSTVSKVVHGNNWSHVV
jgi:hypothetical protein